VFLVMLAVALGTMLPLRSAVAADEAVSKLLDILRERGSISEEEYREIQQTLEDEDSRSTPAPTTSATTEPDPSTGPKDPTGSAVPEEFSGGPTEERLAHDEAQIRETKKELEEQKESLRRLEALADGTSSALLDKALEGKWYERIRVRGYAQLRVSEAMGHDGPELDVPNDRSVREDETFVLRRGRLVFSGDASEHLFFYAQADFAASTGAEQVSLQMRDFYADIAIDKDKEFRFRVGQSKVPFGWVNLQSSRNRAALERPDGINSAFEGERDLGAYLMWAPKEVRKRFADLTSLGLKGSGDYGMIAVGAFSGQGPNESDENGEPHWVARLSYPFQLESGQYVEIGAQAYHGRFVVETAAIDGITPGQSSKGQTDQRAGLSFIWYPQPFGLEAEWNVGRGPELSSDRTRINTSFLHGGYVQLNYRRQTPIGEFFPFVRWNYFDGARKFADNAPEDKVNELDVGFEYAPWREIELTVAYSRTFERTNTRRSSFEETEDANRLGVQVQFRF
jgi:hypothetical protein